MGNCMAWFRKEPNVDHKKDYIQVSQVADALCAELQIKRKTGERFIRRVEKWIFPAEEIDTENPARLEIFGSPIKKGVNINWKWLKGDNFMPFEFYCVRNNYHCYLYKTLGNIREYVSRQHIELGLPREVIVTNFLPDIFAALRDLKRLGLCHTSLCWDSFEIDADNVARLSSLEYATACDQVNYQKIADVRHLPPEVLRKAGRQELQQEKIEVWILGSLLLEILLHKHISGKDFAMSQTKDKPKILLNNIETNVSNFVPILDSSDLSPNMQTLLKDMLCINVNGRKTLDQALVDCGVKLDQPLGRPAGGTAGEPKQTKHPKDSPRTTVTSVQWTQKKNIVASSQNPRKEQNESISTSIRSNKGSMTTGDATDDGEALVFERGMRFIKAVMTALPEEEDVPITREQKTPSWSPDISSPTSDTECVLCKTVTPRDKVLMPKQVITIDEDIEDVHYEKWQEPVKSEIKSEPKEPVKNEIKSEPIEKEEEERPNYPLVTEPNDETDDKVVRLVAGGHEPPRVLISIKFEPKEKNEGTEEGVFHQQPPPRMLPPTKGNEAIEQWKQDGGRPTPPASVTSQRKSIAGESDTKTFESTSDLYKPPESAFALDVNENLRRHSTATAASKAEAYAPAPLHQPPSKPSHTTGMSTRGSSKSTSTAAPSPRVQKRAETARDSKPEPTMMQESAYWQYTETGMVGMESGTKPEKK